ncbi:MAG: glycosyltransferase [Bacteroidales bacterium]|nr:glycosyltransferase [Bacteroidales bacterium]
MSSEAFSNKTVHIVSFDIPLPVNYGGVIDIFNKIKSLHKLGIKIILHNFQYGGRKSNKSFLKYCEEVHYYPRNNNKTNLFSSRPYIVASRSSDELLNRLAADQHPILFEGLHTCLYLSHPKLQHKRKIVRTHNIEHEYYKGLAIAENDPLKAIYFHNESRKLKRFEKNLSYANALAVISRNDATHFSQCHNNVKVISAFHPSEEVQVREGLGNYALYHGSLDVSENNQAALFLVNEVFNNLDYTLVIAGNKPGKELKTACKNMKNIELRTNLKENDFENLIADAQVNVLPTFQSTGIKLKLLLALHKGRHLLVNTPMVDKTGLEELCHVVNTPDEFKMAIHKLMKKEIASSEIKQRHSMLLQNGFSNAYNAENLAKLIFG